MRELGLLSLEDFKHMMEGSEEDGARLFSVQDGRQWALTEMKKFNLNGRLHSKGDHMNEQVP